jgi:hypothetical protein
VAGPLERPDEIGFKEGFDLIELLLVFRSQFFLRDIVGVEGPTRRARMCCQPKPPDGRRQATREPGGPEPLSSALQLARTLRLEFIGPVT